ncbi:MAG: hypothetical protein WC050_03430 [Candidatus Paceibacterota bacterium]
MDPSDHEKEKIERLRRAMYSRSLSPQIKEKPRHALDLTRSNVGEEWEEQAEELPNTMVAPRMIGYTRKILWWFLALSIAFFAAALMFFAYYFTFGGGSLPANPGNIDIAISGPPQIPGGEPAKLQIVVTNRNKVSLELADLVISYPPGTRSPTDFRTDFPSQRISLGSIEAGGKRQGTVSAVFAGVEGQHANVKVELEYRIAASSAIFVASSAYDLAFSSSPISISVDGNTQTVSGQPIQFTVALASNASAPLKDVLLHVDYPFGFTFASSDPSPASTGFWAVGDLSPGERKTVSIRGSLSGQSGDSRVFRIAAGTRTSASSTAISTSLANSSYALSISQPFLGLSITVNKDKGGGSIVAPSDTVNVSIGYQNNLETEITDAIIVARLSGIEIDGATVTTPDGFFRSSDNTVLWDKTTTDSVLSTLAPGAKGVVSFSFQMPSSDALKDISSPHLDISVNAAGKRLSETGVPQNLQSTAQQRMKLATDLQLNAQGLYYANPFGSSGPMPPKAGTETTYALVLTITNTTNKLTNAKVVGILPSYVRWIGLHAPRIENLSFNQSDGSFVWDVGDIAPGVGVNGNPPRQMAISLGLTPSTSQIGQQPAIVRNIVLTGVDAATGATVTRSLSPDVTTNLAQISKSSADAIVGTDPGFSPANATVVR